MGVCMCEASVKVIEPDRLMMSAVQTTFRHEHTHTIHTDILPTQLETLHCPAASVNLITTTPLTILPP